MELSSCLAALAVLFSILLAGGVVVGLIALIASTVDSRDETRDIRAVIADDALLRLEALEAASKAKPKAR